MAPPLNDEVRDGAMHRVEPTPALNGGNEGPCGNISLSGQLVQLS